MTDAVIFAILIWSCFCRQEILMPQMMQKRMDFMTLLDGTVRGSLEDILCNLNPGKPDWGKPCEMSPAPNDYFVAIFQVAPNRLKFGMSTLFVLKNVPVVFFFKNAETYGQNCVKFNPSPPLPLCSSPNNVEFRSLRAKTLCMCLLRYWREIEGGGGGGCEKVGGRVNFQECFWSLASPLVEQKTQEHFLTQKE